MGVQTGPNKGATDAPRGENIPLNIDEIVANCAAGFGEVRLGKLKDAELASLAERLAPEAPRGTRAEQLRAVLRAKRQCARAARSPKSVLRPVGELSESGESESEWEDGASPSTSPKLLVRRDTCKGGAVFAPAPASLIAVAFNVSGMRAHDKETQREWEAAADTLCAADVLLLSEVTPAALAARLPALVARLEATSGVSWSCLHSLPCTGGAMSGKVEHHVALAKAPLRFAASQTLTSVGGCKIDYGLFTVRVEGHALSCNGKAVDVILSSLHLPPSKRASARDRQLERLLEQYPAQAAARLNTPFCASAAREARRPFCAHVLMGDFNRHPGDLLTSSWRALVPRAASTSGGGGSFDNVVLSADATEHLNCSWDVLQLTHYLNCRMSQTGISDHAPVQLTLRSIA